MSTANEKTPLTSQSKDASSEEEPLPMYVWAIALFATINSVNLGFDIGVNSGVGLLIQEDMQLTDWELGIFMGSIHFVAAGGGLMSHEILDRLGRRLTFTVSQFIFLVGIGILCYATTYEQLLVSRVFLGIAIGISLALGPLYIGELSPASHRGRLTTLAEIAINVGILIGFIVNWVFADWPLGVNWRLMTACGAVLPLVLIVLSLTVMPESPRWLIANGEIDKAEVILARTHPAGEDIFALVDGIRTQTEKDKGISALGWEPLLHPDPVTRSMMIVGIGVAFAQQVTGVESVVMYSPEIFKRAGYASTQKELFVATIWVGIVKSVCIVFAALLLDSMGRRPLLLASMAGMACSHVLLASASINGSGAIAALSVLFFVGFFSIGIGPITWIYASEVFPLNIRARALSAATTVNRLTSATVALTFLPLADAIGFAGYFFLFAFFIAAAGIIQYFTCPETKGRTLEQVSDAFVAKEA
jgi:sugar porter (SP) family MFS transporter